MSTATPALSVSGENIPQAWYRAIKAVWEQGALMPTQYDRSGDPPSRDARVMVEIKDPFAEPRFPVLSHVERGAYIAEVMGAKDHLVLPMSTLIQALGRKLEATEWPYTYHQRAVAHPEISGDSMVNQVDMAVNLVAKTPFTRRAMITTAVPNLDPFLLEDIPCLREIQLRCFTAEDGTIYFTPTLTWRSRDCFRAWGDNMIAITFWLARMMDKIAAKIGHRVKIKFGAVVDFSMSLHIYGQCFEQVGGNPAKGLASFFRMSEEEFIGRSMTSQQAMETTILPELRDLLTPAKIAEWQFNDKAQSIISGLIRDMENGLYLP